MKRFSILLPFFLLAASAAAQNPRSGYVIRPLIGTGSRGDGGLAAQALLDGPYGLAEDAQGNIYISESNAGVIRRVRPDGVIERFAGTGILADGAEGKPALETDLLYPTVMVFDRDGGLVFADPKACRIRKVLPDGTIRNLVGTGQCGGSAGGGFGGGTSRDRRALETDIASVGGMILDGAGQLIFTDETNNLVRRLESDGFVRTAAGLGYAGFSGDTGQAASAAFSAPRGLAYDSAANLYVADAGNCRVRRIAPDGVVDTVAGTGTIPGTGGCATASPNFSGGAATRIAIGRVTGLAYDRNTDSLIVSSPSQARVLKLDLASSRISSFLGNGRRGPADTTSPAEYGVDEPSAVLASSWAGILVADLTSFAVLRVQEDGVTPFAGSWPQLATYPSASAAPLLRPRGLCVDAEGSLLVVDAGAERVLRFRHPDQLDAFAGARYPMGYTGGDNGPALEARLNAPARAVCAPNGEVYVVHGRQIRAINREGVIRTVRDFLDDPAGLALDAEGRLIFSEAGAHRVVRYDPAARTSTVIAGTGTAGFSGDGGAATDARLDSPGDLAFDSRNNLFIADRGNRRVRRVSPGGAIQTVAGSTRSFSHIDTSGQPATGIGLDRPDGLAVDDGDNIYISEPGRLNAVRTDGRIYVLSGYIGEDDNGVKFYLDGPRNGCDGVATDRQGRIYFSVRNGGQVVVAEPAGVPASGNALPLTFTLGGVPVRK
ncbi:MAG: hypothetical protein HY822_24895 [Acidobacteria bacterium]|nr:hypothetical protein [Acidobacteriota bacterium]